MDKVPTDNSGMMEYRYDLSESRSAAQLFDNSGSLGIHVGPDARSVFFDLDAFGPVYIGRPLQRRSFQPMFAIRPTQSRLDTDEITWVSKADFKAFSQQAEAAASPNQHLIELFREHKRTTDSK